MCICIFHSDLKCVRCSGRYFSYTSSLVITASVARFDWLNTDKLSRSGNQTKNHLLQSDPRFLISYSFGWKWNTIFPIWIFNTIHLCLLCNNYLYGGPEGQNTRTFFGEHSSGSVRSQSRNVVRPNLYPIFCPPNLLFYFVSSKCFFLILKY